MIPTEAQREAGNYKKEHVRVHGLAIAIENKKGTRRRPEWPRLAADYGYIKRTTGADGDHVDVFIGPNRQSELVVIIDQTDKSGRFDEHKTLIGFDSKDAATKAYLACYSPGWKLGKVNTLTIEQFKRWLSRGNTKQPFAKGDRMSKARKRYELHEAIVEYYARGGPKNSPGQLDLFDGGVKRSSKTQSKFDWDESKHPRAGDGKFTSGASGSKSGSSETRKPKPPAAAPASNTGGESRVGDKREEPDSLAGLLDGMNKPKPKTPSDPHTQPLDIGDRVTWQDQTPNPSGKLSPPKTGTIVSEADGDIVGTDWRVQFDDGTEEELGEDEISHAGAATPSPAGKADEANSERSSQGKGNIRHDGWNKGDQPAKPEPAFTLDRFRDGEMKTDSFAKGDEVDVWFGENKHKQGKIVGYRKSQRNPVVVEFEGGSNGKYRLEFSEGEIYDKGYFDAKKKPASGVDDIAQQGVKGKADKSDRPGYGELAKTPDGRIGRVRGGNGNRIKLINETGDFTYENWDELTKPTAEESAKAAIPQQTNRKGIDGPREGERNAEGLVFRNGRWHRDDDDSKATPSPAGSAKPAGEDKPSWADPVAFDKGKGAFKIGRRDPALHQFKPGTLPYKSWLAGYDAAAAGKEKSKSGKTKPKPGGDLDWTKPAPLDNDKAKGGDQLGLIDGEGKRQSGKTKIAGSGKATQPKMFATDGDPDQMSMFGGDGTPDDLVLGGGSGESEKSKAETPREEAAADAKSKLDDEYAWARKSDIRNAGEDLLDSARHKRNEWRTLEDAEREGTAEKFVTREQLLKNEPHSISDSITNNPTVALTMYLAMKAFPAKPDHGRFSPSDEEKARHREQFLESYRNIKEGAEKIAAKAKGDMTGYNASRELANVVSGEINRLRGARDSSLMGQSAATDKYNAMANNLVNYWRKLSRPTMQKSSPYNKARQFEHENNEGGLRKVGHDWGSEYANKVADVFETGKLKDGAKRGPQEKKFKPADAYVGKIAERKGGPKTDFKTPQQATDYMVEKAKIRGVQFGNSVTDEERKHHAVKTAEALVDLADVLGLPIESISLDEKLGLAIGARGKGGAVAHYEPQTKVINLTRKNGVGSLAHEWGHGFDHMVGGGGMLSAKIGGMGGDSKTASAMRDVKKAWRESGYQERFSKVLKENEKMLFKGAAYWDSSEEKFARTFERYVQVKLESDGRKNTYLAGVETKGYKQGGLWPTDEEVKKMTPAFDALFDAYREEKLGKKERVKYGAEDRAKAVDAIVERYRTNQSSQGEKRGGDGVDDRRKIVKGSFGDRGYFVTIDGNAVFIKAGKVERGPKNIRGKNEKTVRGKRATRSHHDEYRDDAFRLLRDEQQESNEDLRTLLSNFGYTGKRTGAIITAARRATDGNSISRFDEMVDMARSQFGHLLKHDTGSASGRGDDEQALLNRLRDGFTKPISRNDERVETLALEMAGSKPPAEVKVDATDFDFGANAFAAGMHEAIIEHYRAG